MHLRKISLLEANSLRKFHSTKEKILYILKKHPDITMKELTEHFTISEIALRKHLRELIAQKFVKERPKKQEVGRPYYLYSLTEKGHETFPNQYKELPLEILNDIETVFGEDAVEAVLQVKKRREQQILENTFTEDDFDEKIAKLVKYMEEKGYLIECEKTAQGDYEIKTFNCPIYNVATKYKQICTHEKEMYEELFPNSDIQIAECIAKGENYCQWYFRRPLPS